MFTEKEMRIWSLQKRSKRLKKFGADDMILIIGMIIKYIDKDRTLLNILLLSGEVHDTIKEEALKQALLKSDQQRIFRKRKTLWLKLLKIDRQYINGEYQAYHQ